MKVPPNDSEKVGFRPERVGFGRVWSEKIRKGRIPVRFRSDSGSERSEKIWLWLEKVWKGGILVLEKVRFHLVGFWSEKVWLWSEKVGFWSGRLDFGRKRSDSDQKRSGKVRFQFEKVGIWSEKDEKGRILVGKGWILVGKGQIPGRKGQIPDRKRSVKSSGGPL